MPSSEWVKQTSINSVQEFFTSHNQLALSASKSGPTWKIKRSNGDPVSSKGITKEKDNNAIFCKKGSNTGESSSDDSSDRQEHTPRVVAVAMKNNKIKLSCQPQARNLSPAEYCKDGNLNSSLQWTVNSDSSGVPSKTSLPSVSLEQILRSGFFRREEETLEKFTAVSRSNSLTHAGEKSQQVGEPLFISNLSTLDGNVNSSSNNLSTIIAVNTVGSQEEIKNDTNAKLSTEKPVADDESLSSTVITVNCSSNQEGRCLNSPLLPSKVKDFNGKSLVWRESKQKYMQSQHSAGVKVTVSISSQPEKCNDLPPPIPPLPVALRKKFFKNEGNINAKEPQSKVEPVSSSVNGKAPLPLNQLCLHPKIKLKSLQSSPPTFSYHKPSRIPKFHPTLTGLRSVDCLVSLYEDGVIAEQRRKEIQKEGEQKKKISRSLKHSWEELFKKYEALENECDSMSSVTSGSAFKFSSESTSNLFTIKKDRNGSEHNNNSFEVSKQKNHKAFKELETGRLKSAPCNPLHLKGDVESDNTVVLNSLVSGANSEINLRSKSVKEPEWPEFSNYKENKVYLKTSKSEKEINNNQVVLLQSGKEGKSVQCNGAGAVVRLRNVDSGGIGVVCVNTGRQVSTSRYRTELEV
jgi:hypothetical protein